MTEESDAIDRVRDEMRDEIRDSREVLQDIRGHLGNISGHLNDVRQHLDDIRNQGGDGDGRLKDIRDAIDDISIDITQTDVAQATLRSGSRTAKTEPEAVRKDVQQRQTASRSPLSPKN